jgi:hypothetical protein
METHEKNGGAQVAEKNAALPVLVRAKALPALPLVLVDAVFSNRLAVLGRQVKALRITSAADAQGAANLLAEVTVLDRELEKARKAAKQPFLDMGRSIDAAAQTPATALEALKSSVRASMGAWDAEQRRAAEEAERARQAEIARLEAERLAPEEQARRKAEELAAKARPEDVMDLDFEAGSETAAAPKSELDLKIEAAKFAPAVAPAAAPAGVAYRTYLKFTVTDVGALPEQFVVRSANERLLREMYVTGYKDGDPVPSVPGVRFTVDRVPVSTGRGVPAF